MKMGTYSETNKQTHYDDDDTLTELNVRSDWDWWTCKTMFMAPYFQLATTDFSSSSFFTMRFVVVRWCCCRRRRRNDLSISSFMFQYTIQLDNRVRAPARLSWSCLSFFLRARARVFVFGNKCICLAFIYYLCLSLSVFFSIFLVDKINFAIHFIIYTLHTICSVFFFDVVVFRCCGCFVLANIWSDAFERSLNKLSHFTKFIGMNIWGGLVSNIYDIYNCR